MLKLKTAVVTGSILLFASLIFAQDAGTRIPSGSKVYIADMGGFETYLAAAFQQKAVPLIVVTKKKGADFEITGTSKTKEAGAAKIIFGSGRSDEDAGVKVTNLKTGVVAYAFSSHKPDAWNGRKSTAESIAKALKNKILADEKQPGRK